jgi:hypothetical protein
LIVGICAKEKPRRSDPAGFLVWASFVAFQQRLPCIAFSVQLAAEFTSEAAPRTVLHAATARHAPTNTAAANF